MIQVDQLNIEGRAVETLPALARLSDGSRPAATQFKCIKPSEIKDKMVTPSGYEQSRTYNWSVCPTLYHGDIENITQNFALSDSIAYSFEV